MQQVHLNYHCGGCGRGSFPWDETLRLSPQRLTPAAEEVTALAGVQESFGKASKRTLLKLAGLRLCESTVERTTDEAGTRLGAWCHTLKHAGGAVMIRVLERLDRKKMTEEVRDGHDDVLNYLRKNVGRMDYPTYLRNGWQIASGAVESACKTVVNQRLCLGGMRWGEEGSDAVAHLRALYRSDPDQWEAFWGYAMAP